MHLWELARSSPIVADPVRHRKLPRLVLSLVLEKGGSTRRHVGRKALLLITTDPLKTIQLKKVRCRVSKKVTLQGSRLNIRRMKCLTLHKWSK